MTTRTLLLTLAASVAPLYAQQPQASVPAAQLFSELAAPLPATPAATAGQRAQVFGALALLPQDIADFAVLTNVGGNLLRLAKSGTFPELQPDDIPDALRLVDNLAIAGSTATPATYALLRHSLVSLSTLGSSMQLAEGWGESARQELADAIIEELLLRADAGLGLPPEATEGVHLPPAYTIITTVEGAEGEATLQWLHRFLLSETREDIPEGVTPVDDANGFSGIRIEIGKAFRAELEEATANMAPRRREKLMEQLALHPIHLLSRPQGNALIIALCEDPQDLKLPATPDDSLLATDKLAPYDARLGEGMIAAARLSPELAAVYQAANTQPSCNLAAGISAVFSRLAGQDPAHKETFEKAAAAANYLGNEMQKLARPISQPGTLMVWCDGNLHLRATCDAQGCSYAPGELRLAGMADAEKTSLYAETTPMQTGITPPGARALMDAAFAATEGFALTLAAEQQQQAQAALGIAQALLPDLGGMASAGSTIADGLNGNLAFVMDSAQAPLPAVPGAQPGLEAEAPRFALFAGVSDRSKLSDGWEALKASAAQVAVRLGVPAEIVSMLPITTRMAGAATSYSITLPFFTQDAVPSLAVTDSGLALGSSVNLTTQVAESATGNTPFTGAVFALKFAPLARTLRSLATALDHDAEEAEPAANSDVRLEKHVTAENREDGPSALFISTRREDLEDTAAQLSTAAAIFEFASGFAEGMYGTTTVADGVYTLQMEISGKEQ